MTGPKKRLQRGGQQRVGVREVALAAAVSTATVSRFLNAPDTVKARNSERIRAAIDRLGYVPNNAGRSLRLRRSHMIGAIIPTLNHAIFSRLVESLEQRLHEGGYSLLVATSDFDLEKELDQARLLFQRGAEALMLVGDLHRPALVQLLTTQSLPYVNTYAWNPAGRQPTIGFDNHLATAQVTEFLLDMGHRHFGVIAPPFLDNDRASGRVAGVRDTLAGRGIELSDRCIIERPYSIEDGREGLRLLMAQTPRPTAIVCANDIFALGALIECPPLGVKVPIDLSIVGFDDLEFAAHLRPSLTTIEVPADEMGRRAGTYLLDRLQGKVVLDRVRIDLKLIVRETVGRVPAWPADAI